RKDCRSRRQQSVRLPEARRNIAAEDAREGARFLQLVERIVECLFQFLIAAPNEVHIGAAEGAVVKIGAVDIFAAILRGAAAHPKGERESVAEQDLDLGGAQRLLEIVEARIGDDDGVGEIAPEPGFIAAARQYANALAGDGIARHLGELAFLAHHETSDGAIDRPRRLVFRERRISDPDTRDATTW